VQNPGKNVFVNARYVGIGLFVAAFSQLPILRFFATGHSEFLNFPEFSSYRYYTGLSILNGDLQAIWVVQGFPMAIVQDELLRLLAAIDPGGLGGIHQIEIFARATVCIAYFTIGTLLFCMWASRIWSLNEKVVVSAMTIGMWPLTRDYPLLQAPDYWIFEVPFYLVSTLWVLSLLRKSKLDEFKIPGYGFFCLSGLWSGTAFLQKPSLSGFALLPCVVVLFLADSTLLRRLLRAAITGCCAAIAHWGLFLAYFNLDRHVGWTAYRQYWDWLTRHADTGTSLAASFAELLRWSNFLFLPIAIGAVALFVVTIIAFLEARTTSRGYLKMGIIGYLWLLAIAHTLVIIKRTSGTSVVDAMFLGTFSVPILLSLLSNRAGASMRWGLGVVLVAGCLIYKPALLGKWSQVNDATTLRSIDTVRIEVRRIRRPVILLLPDNRIHPYTVEAFGLYTGELALKGHVFDEHQVPRKMPADWLRQRLFPDTFIINRGQDLQLEAAFRAGFVLMWGEAMNAPRIQDFFPGIDDLLAEPGVAQYQHQIVPGGAITAHLAYLKSVDGPVLH
jgi:hypothetical protein